MFTIRRVFSFTRTIETPRWENFFYLPLLTHSLPAHYGMKLIEIMRYLFFMPESLSNITFFVYLFPPSVNCHIIIHYLTTSHLPKPRNVDVVYVICQILIKLCLFYWIYNYLQYVCLSKIYVKKANEIVKIQRVLVEKTHK